MREIKFRTATCGIDGSMPLSDNESVVGAAADGSVLTLLIQQVTDDGLEESFDAGSVADWVMALDGEVLDRRVHELLDDEEFGSSTYGTLYVMALREAAGVD